MMTPRVLLHAVPLHMQPAGQTAGGPGSVTGQVSSDDALEGVDAPPQAYIAGTIKMPSKRMDHRGMFPPPSTKAALP